MSNRSCTWYILFILALASCTNNNNLKNAPEDDFIRHSIVVNDDTLITHPFLQAEYAQIDNAIQNGSIILCRDSLDPSAKQAQAIALSSESFTQYLKDSATGKTLRCEIFASMPARESDLANLNLPYQPSKTYKVELYNSALNRTTIAIIDLASNKVLAVNHYRETQPEIPQYLKALAIKIAVETPSIQKEYGFKPEEKAAIMASTKTSLNRTRCERSRHLCVAPTFIKNDKALWAIVDLTDLQVVGVRWTNVGTTGQVQPLTQRKLQDDKVTACLCESLTPVDKMNWKFNYIITSSDGLRISEVNYKGTDVLQSAKLVDWHVSYSKSDAFGYSDAIGCPYFSQAAVIAYDMPSIAEIMENGKTIGFALEQVFRSELWPLPCNYKYLQRFEFYTDGSFRIAGASLGRGCGNDGTYRPVLRIAFADPKHTFSEWNNNTWSDWSKEKWQLQTSTTDYTEEGYQYKIYNPSGMGYFVKPGNGNMQDGGRGDNAYVYITKHNSVADEGEADLVTIGPCCNNDYKQGPEKFIEPTPDAISNEKLVLWYVAQLRNDNTKGKEYCWAESYLERGVYRTKTYPCFFGPLFVPMKK